MYAAGVPIIPGTDEPLLNLEAAQHAARNLGFPVMLKAVAGGGGRGMRVARDLDELARTFPLAQAEAQAHFGNGSLYLERLIERGRHVEIQIAADRLGSVIHLGERECSIQRRHQKMIEESPSPLLSLEKRAEMGRIACEGVAASGYQNVGTVEFLVDQDNNFYFLR
jgi:acetyl-CoA carboxylase biotin carboxylase subunit